MSITREAKGSIILKTIIVILTALLVYVIYEPFQIQAEEESFRAESRLRMINIRAAQLQFIGVHGRYASTLDSFVAFIESLTGFHQDHGLYGTARRDLHAITNPVFL